MTSPQDSKKLRSRIRAGAAAVLVALSLIGGAQQASAIGTWSTPGLVYDPTVVQTTAYAYAPTTIPGSVDRVWTCHSRSSGTVRDDIFMTKRSGGTVVSSTSVLSGTSGAWDSFHVCDPSVVRVDVTYGGSAYSYAMFYLGNDADCSCHNQIGVAFATSLDGPWVKYPSPVIAFDPTKPTSAWGEGQPSATTVDAAAGSVVLTWSSGYTANPADTKAYFAQISFAAGTPTVSSRHQIQTTGLTDLNGQPDFLNNFDIVYSWTRDTFYMVREAHPYPTSGPDYISSSVQVASLPGSAMWSGSGAWTVIGDIGSSVSGAARTHNPGFSRSIYGTLPDESRIEVGFSTADLDPGSLWTYKVYSTSATL